MNPILIIAKYSLFYCTRITLISCNFTEYNPFLRSITEPPSFTSYIPAWLRYPNCRIKLYYYLISRGVNNSYSLLWGAILALFYY